MESVPVTLRLMRTAALYQLLFGLLSIIGSIVGYIQGDPVVALLIGAVGGLLLLINGLSMQKGSRRAMMLCLLLSVAIGGYFGFRYFADGAGVYPAGVLAVLAAISLLAIGIVAVQPAERKRIF